MSWGLGVHDATQVDAILVIGTSDFVMGDFNAVVPGWTTTLFQHIWPSSGDHNMHISSLEVRSLLGKTKVRERRGWGGPTRPQEAPECPRRSREAPGGPRRLLEPRMPQRAQGGPKCSK